jgi:heterodisulfide reductase subunit C
MQESSPKTVVDVATNHDTAIADDGRAVRCLQCHKCTAGCPLASKMDIQPSQIVRLIQLGKRRQLRESSAIWLCSSCHTCSDRCPAGVDLCRMQDALRRSCIDTETTPADRRSVAASSAVLQSIADTGRMNELSVVRRYKTQTNTLFDKISLGIALVFRGKLKFFKKRIRARRQVRQIIRRFVGRTDHRSE